MAPSRQRDKTAKSLKAGRPTNISKATSETSNLSASKSRQLIRSHHQLNKAHAQAVAAGDEEHASRIAAELEALGGLVRYQQASKAGQSLQRGGDSSILLMEWLRPLIPNKYLKAAKQLSMLEVGALSTQNACSSSGLFAVTCIDLNAQGKGILKQDFMERPLPEGDEQRFDCVSLSLVLNYVPHPKGRGEMLKRVSHFLRRQVVDENDSKNKAFTSGLPSLFLVLPSPCVTNSRYLDEGRLVDIMGSLGFRMQQRKLTEKLVYYLWVLEGLKSTSTVFPKVEVRSGKLRNNFAVALG